MKEQPAWLVPNHIGRFSKESPSFFLFSFPELLHDVPNIFLLPYNHRNIAQNSSRTPGHFLSSTIVPHRDTG